MSNLAKTRKALARTAEVDAIMEAMFVSLPADVAAAGRAHLAAGGEMRDDIADIDDDAARPSRAERLNAVFVIARARQLTQAEAITVCQARAAEHCETARKRAVSLPAGAGTGLVAVAQRFVGPLRPTADAA